MTDEIRYLGDLQRLDLRPGDVFVLTVEGHLSNAQVEAIQHHWNMQMPGHKLLVLQAGMKLGVMNGAGEQ